MSCGDSIDLYVGVAIVMWLAIAALSAAFREDQDDDDRE